MSGRQTDELDSARPLWPTETQARPGRKSTHSFDGRRSCGRPAGSSFGWRHMAARTCIRPLPKVVAMRQRADAVRQAFITIMQRLPCGSAAHSGKCTRRSDSRTPYELPRFGPRPCRMPSTQGSGVMTHLCSSRSLGFGKFRTVIAPRATTSEARNPFAPLRR